MHVSYSSNLSYFCLLFWDLPPPRLTDSVRTSYKFAPLLPRSTEMKATLRARAKETRSLDWRLEEWREGGRADGLRKQHSHYIHLDCPNIDLSKRHYDMGCLSRTYAPRIPLLSPMM